MGSQQVLLPILMSVVKVIFCIRNRTWRKI